VKATVYHGARDVRVETVPDPAIQAPTDALVRVVNAAICGSDLWPYRGVAKWEDGARLGHEFTGIVEAVGGEVTGVAVGQFVAAPFSYADGSCAFCAQHLYTSCRAPASGAAPTTTAVRESSFAFRSRTRRWTRSRMQSVTTPRSGWRSWR
jgi:threonine dehydrogenase-like Zn-dependent dehydrogenase